MLFVLAGSPCDYVQYVLDGLKIHMNQVCFYIVSCLYYSY